MKTFVINLERDRDRWAHISKHLQETGLDFERMHAIYGGNLTTNELSEHYDPIKAKWRQARPLTAAEIGCALSHLCIYREISKRDLPRALILEDDVVLKPDVPMLLGALESYMPEGEPIICLLSPALRPPQNPGIPLSTNYSLRDFESGYFTSSYVLTRSAAELLLGDLHPVSDVADCWHRLAKLEGLRILSVTPAATHQKQDEFGSSTTQDINTFLGRSPFSLLQYKILRARNLAFSRFIEARWRDRTFVISARDEHTIDKLKG